MVSCFQARTGIEAVEDYDIQKGSIVWIEPAYARRQPVLRALRLWGVAPVRNQPLAFFDAY